MPKYAMSGDEMVGVETAEKHKKEHSEPIPKAKRVKRKIKKED